MSPRRPKGALLTGLALLALAAAACDSGATGRSARGRFSPPTVGDLIDRTGRPSTTRFLVAPFAADPAAQADARASWNETERPEWSTLLDTVERSLAEWDALSGTCGDFPGYAPDDPGGPYGVLARIIVDDQLYVDTSRGSVTVYFGTELEALGLLPEGAGGSGGRSPLTDAVDVLYSVLLDGSLEGRGDGVPADDVTPPDGFPYVLVR